MSRVTSDLTRRIYRTALAAALVGAPVIAAPPAHAAGPGGVTVTGGCRGVASSQDAGGAPLGAIDTAAGIPASRSKPFLVDPAGNVTYRANSPAAITDNTWNVKIAGVSVDSGASANRSGTTTTEDAITLKDYLPFPVTGTMLVEASLRGAGGTCTGAVWIKAKGNPLTSTNGLAGIGLTAGGLLAAIPARPRTIPGPRRSSGPKRRPVLGLLAGLLVGVGALLSLTSTSVVPMSSPWVLGAIVVLGLVAGLSFGMFGPAGAARDAAALVTPPSE
jgi:hypothetical protein